MAVELVTIPAVPILRTGTYPLSSGEATFSEEDLAAAADALANDQGVKAPRIKIDSLEQALDLDPDAHGGEPAFGYVDNLTVVDKGQTLVGDFHVPPAVEAAMEWAYPALSIEGTGRGWVSTTGREHALVITAVALLGVHWPGVATLNDFFTFLTEGPEIDSTNAPEEVLATMPQRAREVVASLDVDLLRSRFIDVIDSGGMELPDGVDDSWSLWITAIRLDDSGTPYLKVVDESNGDLYRVDFTIAGNKVTFKSFTEVMEQDVPVTASSPARQPIAAWASRAEFRPSKPAAVAAQAKEQTMPDIDMDALRRRLGLPEDATEDQINEAIAADPAAEGEEGDEPAGAEGGEGEPAGGEQPAGEGEGGVEASGLPEGFVAVPAEKWAEVQAGAKAGNDIAKQTEESKRDTTITAAIKGGKVRSADRESLVNLHAKNRDSFYTLLTAKVKDGGLAENLVPVDEIGRSGDGDDPITASLGEDGLLPAGQSLLNDAERARLANR
jgi:hypothetical protein